MTALKKLKHFLKDECGASMVEYGVALLVVTGVGVAVMANIGTITGATVMNACTVVDQAGGGTNC